MKTIRSHWDSFAAQVVPKDAGLRQRIDCRRAFYAGASAVLSIALDLGDDSVSEEAGMAILDGLRSEAQDFAKAVVSGDA